MRPAKHNEVIKPTAEKLGVSENLVSDVSGFYWSSVKNHIKSLEHPRISIINFGSFIVKKKTLEKLMLKYDRVSKKLIREESKDEANIKRLISYNDKMSKLLILIDAEKDRYTEKRKERKEYVANKAL